MLNSTKTWQDRLKILIPEKTDNVIIHGYRQLTRGKIKQFITDLRKRDMEALIGIMKDKFAPSDNFLTIDLIKDYYENQTYNWKI